MSVQAIPIQPVSYEVRGATKTTSLSKRGLVSRGLDLTGMGHVLRRFGCWNGVIILNYHRVGDGSSSLFDQSLWSATTNDFDLQMRFIRDNFRVIGLPDLSNALENPAERAVMITFDDGYLDNYTEAFPILQKYNLPATFFLTSDFLDTHSLPWWDLIAWMVRVSHATKIGPNLWIPAAIQWDSSSKEQAIHRLLKIYKTLTEAETQDYLDELACELKVDPKDAINESTWMTWDMVREMNNAGMTFGGHTVNHPVLANIPARQQDYEIGESVRRLREEISGPVNCFSFPVGGSNSYNERTLALLRHHGIDWGFTFVGGHCPTKPVDRLQLPRTAVENDIDLSLFRAILTLPQYFG